MNPSRPERRNSKDGGKSISGRTGSSLAKSASNTSANTMSMASTMGGDWHSVRSTLNTRTDDDTMHTCLGGDTSMADTLVGSEDLHSCADTLNDQMYESDNEMFEEMLPRDRNSKTFD